MSTHRNRMSRSAAEHLLHGSGGNPTDLTAMLRAAAAPGSPSELAGEYEAVAALRAARLTPSPTPRRRTMLKTALAQLVAAKVATTAAVAAAAATGGLALAAATGSLPSPLQDAAHAAFGAPTHNSSTHTAAPTETQSDEPSAEPSPTSSSSSGTEDPTSTTTPSPSLVGLCTAFHDGAAENHGKMLDSPAFTVLINAAGGKDNVATFCATVITARPTHSGGEPSDQSSHDTGRPTDQPSHPEGRPTDQPSHPEGRPSSEPARRSDTPGGDGSPEPTDTSTGSTGDPTGVPTHS